MSDADESLDFDIDDVLAGLDVDDDETPPDQPDAPAAPETEPAAPARDDGRDEKGRFAAKAAPPADSPDAPAPDGAAPVAVGAQPTPDAVPSPQANAADPSAPPDTPPTEPQFEPFVVRMGDQTVPIPGAVVTPDGAVIPPAALEQVHTLMGRGLKYDAERQQIKAEKQRLEYEQRTHQAQLAPLMQELDRFFAMTRELHGAKDEASQLAASEKILAYALEFAANEPLLQERMKLERERAEFDLQRRAQEPEPAEVAAQLEQRADQATTELLGEAKQHPDYKVLTDKDWQAIGAKLQTHKREFFYIAGERLSPEERAAGIQPGHLVMNVERVKAELDYLRDIRADMAAQAAQHQKALEAAAKVAAENAKRTAAPVVAPSAPRKTQPPRPKPKPADDDFDMDDLLDRAFADME